jgi:hypothetical protein
MPGECRDKDRNYGRRGLNDFTRTFPRRLRLPPGRASAGLDHAPGRPLPSRVPRTQGPALVRRVGAHAGTRRRGFAAAAAPLCARCRHPLLRHPRRPGSHGPGISLQGRGRHRDGVPPRNARPARPPFQPTTSGNSSAMSPPRSACCAAGWATRPPCWGSAVRRGRWPATCSKAAGPMIFPAPAKSSAPIAPFSRVARKTHRRPHRVLSSCRSNPAPTRSRFSTPGAVSSPVRITSRHRSSGSAGWSPPCRPAFPIISLPRAPRRHLAAQAATGVARAQRRLDRRPGRGPRRPGARPGTSRPKYPGCTSGEPRSRRCSARPRKPFATRRWRLLESMRDRPGHIVNLGHGICPMPASNAWPRWSKRSQAGAISPHLCSRAPSHG